MQLEQQVTSLELSKKLNELGVPQESLFRWYENLRHTESGVYCDLWSNWDEYDGDWVAAYTVAELGELLPPYIGSHKRDEKRGLALLGQWI